MDEFAVRKAAFHECGHAFGLCRQGNLARVYIEKDAYMSGWGRRGSMAIPAAA